MRAVLNYLLDETPHDSWETARACKAAQCRQAVATYDRLTSASKSEGVKEDGTPVPDAVNRAVERILQTFRGKSRDYTSAAWDDNFTRVGGQCGITREDVCEVLIGVKQARLSSLRGKTAVNESELDTVLDRAVYSVIALAMRLDGGEGVS